MHVHPATMILHVSPWGRHSLTRPSISLKILQAYLTCFTILYKAKQSLDGGYYADCKSEEVSQEVSTPYGTKYIVEGGLITPSGSIVALCFSFSTASSNTFSYRNTISCLSHFLLFYHWNCCLTKNRELGIICKINKL